MTSNEKWKLAPIVTSNNSDRLAQNSIELRQFFIETNQIFVKLKKKLSNENIPLSALNKLYEKILSLNVILLKEHLLL